jgi:hypothetical protein
VIAIGELNSPCNLSTIQRFNAPTIEQPRAQGVRTPNPEVNKSRAIQVERLTFLISYEKNPDRISHGCFRHVCSSAGEGSRYIG